MSRWWCGRWSGSGWLVTPADPHDPQPVSVMIGPNLLVTGHPDAIGRVPLDRDEAVDKAATTAQMFLFEDETPAPVHGDAMIVEIKTRGPEAFKRWRDVGG